MRGLPGVALVVALVLSGCTGPDAEPAAATVPTSQGPQAAFSVPAPDLQAGQLWIASRDVTGQVKVSGFIMPVDEHLSFAIALLAGGYSASGRPVLVGMNLQGPAGAQGLADMRGMDPMLLDRATLVTVPLDTRFLRACQVEPSSCPTDLAPHIPAGSSLAGGSLRFPLEPGLTWDIDETNPMGSQSLHFAVRGLEPLHVVGEADTVVHVNVTGQGEIHFEEDGMRGDGTFEVSGTLSYSAAHESLAAERSHTKGDVVMTDGGDSVKMHMDLRSVAALTRSDRDAKPDLDPVELYDAFGFRGRDIRVEAKPDGPGRLAVELVPVETPRGAVSWTLIAPDGKEFQAGQDLRFTATLGDGIHRLRAQAVHKGVTLVVSTANLTAAGVIADEPTPVDVKGTVACDPFVLGVAPGLSHGACPGFAVPLGKGLSVFTATSLANSTFPQGVEGTLEILDPSGVVVASAEAGAEGSLTHTADSTLDPGEWQVRFRPRLGLQMTVFFHATATQGPSAGAP